MPSKSNVPNFCTLGTTQRLPRIRMTREVGTYLQTIRYVYVETFLRPITTLSEDRDSEGDTRLCCTPPRRKGTRTPSPTTTT